MTSVQRLSDLEWSASPTCDGEDTLYTAYLIGGGRLTVLDRVTGYSCGRRDIESGYKDKEGRFWLASGDFDIRSRDVPVDEAIELIKANANTCVGD